MDKTLHLLIMYTMLVLMLLLLHKGRKDKRGLFLAAYAFIEVLTNGIDGISLLGGEKIFEKFPAILFMTKTLTLLWVPFFWFYIRSCFSKDFRWENKRLFHLLPFGLFLAAFLILRGLKGAQYIADNMFRFGSLESYALYSVDIAVRLQYLIYNTVLVVMLIRVEKQLKLTPDPENLKLNSNIKWLRFIVYGYAIACLGAVFTFIMFHFNWPLANRINFYSILYFFIFFFVIFYDTIVPKSLYLKKSSKALPEINDEMKQIIKKLDALLTDEKVFLDPELSLSQLASTMEEKERAISQAINTLKQRNFKDYINSYRINHACNLLKEHTDKPIFEVMFESGFNTKGPFNTAFKKITGKTPSEYRQD